MTKATGVYLPAPQDANPLKIVHALRQLAAGQTNALGSFTLSSTGATSLTVLNISCGVNSFPHFTPTTSNAAAANASLYCATTDVTTGQFIIHYSSSTSSGATFNYTLHS